MGVKKASSILNKLTLDSINIKDIKNKRIVIDIMPYIFKYYLCKKKTTNANLYIIQLCNFINKFINNNNIIYCVFDGIVKPIEKNKNINNNIIIKSTKNFPSYDEIELLKKIIATIYKDKVIVYTAISEGENLCMSLYNENKIDIIISEDSDLIIYKCPRYLSKYNNNNFKIIVFDNITNKFNITSDDLVNLCILLGTDYCNGINLKIDKIIEKIKNNQLHLLIEKFNDVNKERLHYYNDVNIFDSIKYIYKPIKDYTKVEHVCNLNLYITKKILTILYDNMDKYNKST